LDSIRAVGFGKFQEWDAAVEQGSYYPSSSDEFETDALLSTTVARIYLPSYPSCLLAGAKMASNIRAKVIEHGNTWTQAVNAFFQDLIEPLHAEKEASFKETVKIEKGIKYGTDDRHRLDVSNLPASTRIPERDLICPT
jgi:hypothetical protein